MAVAPTTNNDARDNDIRVAAAFLSTSGPCRAIGDVYLTCVATAGLGMCRSLRAEFEQCAKSTEAQSQQMLQELGDQVCRQLPTDTERLACAADLVNQQLMQGYSLAQMGAMGSNGGGTASN